MGIFYCLWYYIRIGKLSHWGYETSYYSISKGDIPQYNVVSVASIWWYFSYTSGYCFIFFFLLLLIICSLVNLIQYRSQGMRYGFRKIFLTIYLLFFRPRPGEYYLVLFPFQFIFKLSIIFHSLTAIIFPLFDSVPRSLNFLILFYSFIYYFYGIFI